MAGCFSQRAKARRRCLVKLALLVTAGAWACEPLDPTVVARDLPEDVAWVGAIFLSEDGDLVAATGLTARSATGAFLLALKTERRGEIARALVVGYTQAQLTAYDPPHATELSRTLLSLAGPLDRHLPDPPHFAACTRFEGATQVAVRCPAPQLTSSWLARCPDPCDLGLGDPIEKLELSPPGVRLHAAFPYDASRTAALIIGADGRMFRATATSAVSLPRSSNTTYWMDGFARDDGEIWLLTAAGEVFAGRPATGFQRVTVAPPSAESFMQIAGSPTGPLELATFDQSGRVLRFDGTTWSTLREGSPDPCCRGQMEWLGPGQLAAAVSEANEIFFYDKGDTRVDRRLVDPRAIAMVPGFGLVVATAGAADLAQETELYVQLGATWQRLPTPRAEVGEVPLGVWPFGSGFVYGGLRGRAAFYQPGLGDCATRVITSGNVIQLVALKEATIAVPDPNMGPRTELWVYGLPRTPPDLTGCGVQ